jgi:hypothetical protein
VVFYRTGISHGFSSGDYSGLTTLVAIERCRVEDPEIRARVQKSDGDMLLKGHIEAVERFQARGWAYDGDQPEQHLVVELVVAGQPIGTVVANLWRADLEQNGVGVGDHSFVYNFSQPISDDLLAQVTARVCHRGGRIALERWQESDMPPKSPPEEREQIGFAGVSQDETRNPLFILGAARSGTTAVTQALLKATHYQGHGEGHVLDLLAELYVTVDRFYRFKAEELSDPHRATTIGHVPVQFFRDGFDNLALEAMRSVFPPGAWLDKTPTTNMIHIAGQLRRIWPQAKFIYLKRRAFENVASRTRKFVETSFEVDCREWTGAMKAWRGVLPLLDGSALQLDQLHLARAPDQAAHEIADFLALDPAQTERLRQALSADWPERTGGSFSQVFDPAELGWSEQQWQVFNDVCGAELDALGYSRGPSYYASDDPSLRVKWI